MVYTDYRLIVREERMRIKKGYHKFKKTPLYAIVDSKGEKIKVCNTLELAQKELSFFRSRGVR